MQHRSILDLRLLSAVLSAFFILPTVTAAQVIPGEGMDSGLGGQNIIAGSVFTDSGGRLARRIQIRLSTMTRGDRTVMTDEKGNFVIRGVPNGNYTVTIDKEKDFEPFSQVVDVIQLRGSPASTYTLNVVLKSKGSDLPKAGVVNAEFADVPKPALEHYVKATAMSKAGDLKGALGELRLAVEIHPTFVQAFNEIGVLHLRMNDNAEAATAFRSALKINSESFAPLLNLGIALFNLKQYVEAETVLRAAIKLDLSSVVAHFFLGQALANEGKFDEAETELLIATKAGDPKMREAHRILAIIYNSRGNKAKFISELEAYVKLAPNAPDAPQIKQMIQQAKSEPKP